LYIVLNRGTRLVDFVQFDDLNATRELTVDRAEKRAFSFEHRSSPGLVWQIVAQIETAYACRIVTLCSTVQVELFTPVTHRLT